MINITWRESVLVLALVGALSAWVYERDHRHGVIVDRVPSVTALCKDGTYSTSNPGRGQCSHHGGVQKIIIRG